MPSSRRTLGRCEGALLRDRRISFVVVEMLRYAQHDMARLHSENTKVLFFNRRIQNNR